MKIMKMPDFLRMDDWPKPISDFFKPSQESGRKCSIGG